MANPYSIDYKSAPELNHEQQMVSCKIQVPTRICAAVPPLSRLSRSPGGGKSPLRWRPAATMHLVPPLSEP